MSTEMVKGVEQVKAEIAPVVQQAADLAVGNPEQYRIAAEFLKRVKAAERRVSEFWAPIKEAAHIAWKKTTEGERALLNPLIEAEANVKRKMLCFQQEQENIRLAEQRRLQAEADAKARQEQERLLKLAEARKTPEKQAEYREAAAAVVAPVVQVASTTPVIAGQSIRRTWKARVVEVEKVPREWLVVNEKALDAFARSTKGAVKVPGVEFYEESTLASAGK